MKYLQESRPGYIAYAVFSNEYQRRYVVRYFKRKIILVLAPYILACAPIPASAPRPQDIAPVVHSALLAELAREDQASRTGENIARTDADRVQLVLAEIAKGAVATPEDKFNAALVLQHTGMTFCGDKLVSLSPDNYLLAHHLANGAFTAGYERARHLVAQTIDRYLSLTQGYQKYGTNRFINQAAGAEEWAPIDRSTTDSERARYGVAPLADLLRQFPEQKRTPRP